MPPPNMPRPAPIPLRPQARQLSITAEDLKSEGCKRIIEQLQSFFFRLPLEIRLRIYEYALGGRILHLGLLYEGSDSGKPVRLRRHACKYGDTHPVANPTWTNCSTPHDQRSDSLLPFLQSCRRV